MAPVPLRHEVADARARWIARLARTFGCSMAEVRAMTIRDVGAMAAVVKEEQAAQERRRQAQRARSGRRG